MTTTTPPSPDPTPSAPEATLSRRERRRAAHAAQPTWHRALRWTSFTLMGLAVLLVGYVGVLIGYQSYEQHRLTNVFNDRTATASIHDVLRSSTYQPAPRPHLAVSEPIFKLDIASINFSAIVVEGADSGILSSGPGHDIHTAYPGEGKMILVGNHNGFSLSWGDLKVGDHIVLTTSGDGDRYTYVIQKRSIVDGDDNTIVASHEDPKAGEVLVMSTCWPLWEGAFARQRLVFEATPLLNATPAPSPPA